MIELWSAQQHEWLAALGHEVLVQGTLPQEEVVEVAVPQPPMRAAPAARPPQAVARAPRPDPGSTRSDRASARPMPAQSPVRMPDRLHFALIRASGCNPNSPEAQELIAQWPPATELRGNPAAKRALWPRLRALRRPTPP